MSFTWNNDLVFKLIELFRERPILWDHTLEEYRDKNRKKNAWLEIAKSFSTDIDVVERKMKCLLTQFRRELKRTPKSGTTEISQWFAFKKLLFMKFKIMPIDVVISAELPKEKIKEEDETNPTELQCCAEIVEIPINEPGQVHTKKEGEESERSQRLGVHIEEKVVRPMHRKRSQSAQLTGDKSEETYKIVKDLQNYNQTRDEYTIFGEHVAAKLRKMSNTYGRCTAQYHINNILYNAEIGLYDCLTGRRESFNRELGYSYSTRDIDRLAHLAESLQQNNEKEYIESIRETAVTQDQESLSSNDNNQSLSQALKVWMMMRKLAAMTSKDIDYKKEA